MWEVFSLDNVCITDRKDSAARTITYSSSQLTNFFLQLFDNTGIWKEKRADNSYHYLTQWDKKIPNILKHIDPKKQLQIFKGWFLGDGYARAADLRDRQAKVTTVSKKLADDMIEILHRNYINPSVDIECRNLNKTNRCDCYNLSLYGDYATYLYNYKYIIQDFSQVLEFPIECMRTIDVPVIYNSKLYLKTKLQSFYVPDAQEETVYCLKMPHKNFSVNNTIVHNCRGYRTADFPDGIDIDEAQYMSSLIPQERGFLWPIKDVVNGNPDKDRKPITQFINEVNKYPGLLEIITSIEGIINKRSSHASGVILYDEDPFETAAFMRTPGGDLITCYDLHRAEIAGDTKYDLLLTEASDKIIACYELLKKYKEIPDLTLKEFYDKYLHPEVMDVNDTRLWDHLAQGDVLDCFQFSTSVGLQIAKKLKPKNPMEMVAANAMMRLMSEKGQESQQDRYYRIQQNGIDVFEREMKQHNIPTSMRLKLHRHCDPYYGCCPLQEQMMEILMDIADFTLGEANAARKIVAKKQMSKIPELREQVFAKFDQQDQAEYFWQLVVAPQLGYAFSINHSLPYSFVGLQMIYLAINYNPIYWDTACLIVNSGSLEATSGASTDYKKIAKAIGDIQSVGIKVSLANINQSDFGFSPDVKNQQILFGLKGILNVGEDLIAKTIENRPYSSPRDYLNKVSPNRSAMIALIKSGAFDDMMDRKLCLGWYIWETCDKKKNLTLQNLNGLMMHHLLPEETEEQLMARRIYEFTRYLKVVCFYKGNDYFELDERAINFLTEIGKLDLVKSNKTMSVKAWDNIYQSWMNIYRDWIASSKEEILRKLNNQIFKEDWEKYAGKANLSAWEMEVLCFYYHEHELAHINKSKYGIIDFKNLCPTPTTAKTFEKGGRTINIYNLYKICGTCIAKDKLHSSISLLTTDGVVEVKFAKSYFPLFDKQISCKNADGVKKVVEKSWFTRGNMLVVQGIRTGDSFMSKNYASSGSHQLYKIAAIEPDGDITLCSERAQGEAEDAD